MARRVVKFTGDFAALEAFSDRLDKIPKSHRIITKNLAEETIGLIRDGFEKSEDPYGKPWSHPVFRNGRPMEDTGGLKASWKRRSASSKRFSVSSTKVYARYLQEGTGLYGPRRRTITPVRAKALRIPIRGGSPLYRSSVRGLRPRKMVPKPGYLPRRWRHRYIETANDVIAGLLKAA